MAHNLNTVNGKVSFAYAKQDGEAWHGMGQALEATASTHDWAVGSGLAWKLERSPVRFQHDYKGAKVLGKLPSHDVLYCNDTMQALGIVGADYKIVQPEEALEFFREFTDRGQMRMTSAGVLGERRVIWAQAQFAEGSILGDDEIKGKLLFTTGMCGNRATEVRNVTERVVCANTLRIAMGEKAPMSVRVTHRSVFDADRVKAQMAQAREAFDAFLKVGRALTQIRLSVADAEKMATTLLRPEGNVNEEGKEMRKPRGLDSIMALFQGEALGAGMKGVEGSAWGFVNAVTQHVDHIASAKTQDTRTMSAWLGEGDIIKANALQAAMKLLQAA